MVLAPLWSTVNSSLSLWKCVLSPKMPSASGGHLPPDSHQRLCPQTPVIGSRARHSSPPFCSPNFKLLAPSLLGYVLLLRRGKWCQSTSSSNRDVDRLIADQRDRATPFCRADKLRDATSCRGTVWLRASTHYAVGPRGGMLVPSVHFGPRISRRVG